MSVPGAGEGGEFVRELLGVEVAVAPGDFAVVDVFVVDAVVSERHEELRVDAGDEVFLKDEVVVAEGEDIGLVGAVGGGGEAEQQLGAEVIEPAAVAGGGGMVELIHDHHLEALAWDLSEGAIG